MEQRQLFTLAAWRALVTLIAVAIVSLTVWSLCYFERSTIPGKAGTIGFAVDGTGGQKMTVTSVVPQSDLAAAALQVGDSVILDHHIDLFRRLGTDERIGMTIISGGAARHVVVRPAASPVVIGAPGQAAAVALMALVMTILASILAFLIGRYRGETTLMRVLCLVLFCLAWDGLDSYLPAHARIAAFLYMAVSPFSIHFVWCGLLYVCLTAQDEHALWSRRSVRVAFWCYVAVCATRSAYLLASLLGALPSVLDTDSVFRAMALLALVSGLLLTLWALRTGWRGSIGSARQRLAWVGGLFLMVYAKAAPFWLNLLLDLQLPQTVRVTMSFTIFTVGLIGLTFTLFRHRVFDFSFAVNRALVFTVISTFLLIVFSITEFAIDKLLHFEGREKNVIVDAAVALLVILSFHRIQHWVSHRIDHTFFHHWYAAAEKLRLFIARATHITDNAVLQEKYLGAMQQFCNAPELAQYLRNGDTYMRTRGAANLPATLGFDSDLVVALRHARRHLDLQAEDLALAADYVFPMLLRGDLQGFIVLLPKTDGGAYRPDEIVLLAESVAHYALDLETLRVADLEREMAALRLANSDLLGANGALTNVNTLLEGTTTRLELANEQLRASVDAFARSSVIS